MTTLTATFRNAATRQEWAACVRAPACVWLSEWVSKDLCVCVPPTSMFITEPNLTKLRTDIMALEPIISLFLISYNQQQYDGAHTTFWRD